jgi:hypothetical protein
VIEKDSTDLRVIVMWEHVTPSDKKISYPPMSALFRIPDARAVQFWDDERALSRLMVQDLPGDTLNSVAEADSGRAAIAWDCIALYGSGRRWGQRFPVPDWAGRPVSAVVDTMLVRLRGLERVAAADSAR